MASGEKANSNRLPDWLFDNSSLGVFRRAGRAIAVNSNDVRGYKLTQSRDMTPTGMNL